MANKFEAVASSSEYPQSPAAGEAVGWLRDRHNEGLRRWIHWGFGSAALWGGGEILAAIGTAISTPVLAPALGIVGLSAALVGIAGLAITGVGSLVNVAAGRYVRAYMNPESRRARRKYGSVK